MSLVASSNQWRIPRKGGAVAARLFRGSLSADGALLPARLLAASGAGGTRPIGGLVNANVARGAQSAEGSVGPHFGFGTTSSHGLAVPV